jgi:hypothetical protein
MPIAMHGQRLSERQVASIRQLHARGVQGTIIAERFGVSPAYVSMLVRNLRRPRATDGPIARSR